MKKMTTATGSSIKTSLGETTDLYSNLVDIDNRLGALLGRLTVIEKRLDVLLERVEL